MEVVEASLVLIGLINGVKLFELEDKRSFYYFVGAVVLGVLFGVLHLFGVPSIEAGVILALQSSGLYKLAQVV